MVPAAFVGPTVAGRRVAGAASESWSCGVVGPE